MSECFERTVNEGKRNAKVTANFCINEILAALNKKDVTFLERQVALHSFKIMVYIYYQHIMNQHS